MRRRLEEAHDESEARALELQSDVEALRSQLEEQGERARRAEREQATLVAELAAQNTRLADQLREANKQEEQLLAELRVLRDKCNLRSTTLQDHVSSLEILRDEVKPDEIVITKPIIVVSNHTHNLYRFNLISCLLRFKSYRHKEPNLKGGPWNFAKKEPGPLRPWKKLKNGLWLWIDWATRLNTERERRNERGDYHRFMIPMILVLIRDRLCVRRDELAATLAALEAERRGRSGSIQKPPRSLQAEMECEESGSSLGEPEDLKAEVTRACKRMRELCAQLRRGEDDSGLQSDCDESMLVIANGADTEVRVLSQFH